MTTPGGTRQCGGTQPLSIAAAVMTVPGEPSLYAAWVEWAEAALKLPHLWHSNESSVWKRRGQKERGRDMPLRMEGKAGILTSFDN